MYINIYTYITWRDYVIEIKWFKGFISFQSDNNQILNNRQPSINVAENNHIPTTMISYKPQNTDEILHVYTEKQPYHSSPSHDEHAHLFHGQEHLKQQSDHVKSEFYDVTLDLTHDDIQQTLSANMPVSCGNTDQLLR